MAEFKIHELEGTRYVDIHLNEEAVRIESGAISYLTGNISVHSKLVPSPGGLIKSLLAEEAIYRPLCTGTGVITLESSLGGFHKLDLQHESWILERGAYWASEGSVDVSFHREKMSTSLFAGEGPLYLQTRLNGPGKVILTTRGPVEEIVLSEGQELAAEGSYVIARTASVKFLVRRSTKNFFGRFTAGEGRFRVFQGPGNVLLNPAPYWRYRLFAKRGQESDFSAKASS